MNQKENIEENFNNDETDKINYEEKKTNGIKRKIRMPMVLFIFIIIMIILGTYTIVWGALAYKALTNRTTFNSILLVGLEFFGFMTVAFSLSYGVSYWHKEKQQEDKIIKEEIFSKELAQETNNIDFLKMAREDVNNYITFLENKKDSDLVEPINYLYEVKSQITTKLGKIISGEEEMISEEEKLLFRTNTPEDFKYIIKYLNKNKQFDKLQEILGKNFYLKGANLKGANLKGSNLSGANLSDANLSNVNLEEANLEEANLQGTSLYQANLQGINLQKANIKNVIFSKAKLTSDENIKTNLSGIDFSLSLIEGTDFSGTDLSEVKLKGLNLSNAILKDSNLSGVNLEKTTLKWTILENTNLSNANLDHTDLRWALLDHANLSGANLKNTNLKWAHLYHVNIEKADLSETNLKNTFIEK